MEEFKSFFDLADEIIPFDPPYTEEFCKFMEESIRESKRMQAEALRTAREIIIF
jgi:hypothetical protein